jgi:two-component system, LytTR family, response regulator
MTTIRTLIVDDEELARRRLRRMLAAFAEVQISGEAANGAEAVARLEAEQLDLVFLDVQMPDLDGFGVLELVAVPSLPLVVFVTAFDQYAVNAFEVSAVDYLLKPVHRQRLEQTLGKVRERLSQPAAPQTQLTQLLQQLQRPHTGYLQRLPVRAQQRILILNVEQIIALRVEHGVVCAATAEGEFWTKYTALTELEAMLDPAVFQRVHRQVLVNLNHVREISAFDNNTARLTLTGGQQVNVSRNHLPELRRVLNW